MSLLVGSCANQSKDLLQTPSIIVLPYFTDTAVGKASEVSFDVGDRIGLYATLKGQEIRAAGNLIDNALFESSADGSIRARPVDIFYPDKSSMVELLAYYPYQSTISDITALAHSVKLNQSTAADLSASDLCLARQTTHPTAEPRPMHFRHLLSKLNFSVTLPAKIGERTVASLSQISLLEAVVDVTLNAASTSADPVSLGSIRHSVVTSASDLIVPAQRFTRHSPLLSITVRYTNSQTESFTFAPPQDIVLAPSTTSSFSLSLSDKGSVELSGGILVEPWTECVTQGAAALCANNSFTAHWRLPHPDFASINSVVLSVRNSLTGQVSDLPATFTRIEPGATSTMCAILFSFEPTAATGLSYPYSVERVKFYKGLTLVQDCPSLIAVNVYKRGDYTLGIDQDNILTIGTGAIGSWDDLVQGGGVNGGGVTSSFRIRLIEPPYEATKISSIHFKIGSRSYVFDGLTIEAGSNVLLSTTSEFTFPDKNGFSPTAYPYTIDRVDLYDNRGLLLSSLVTSLEVARSGLVTLQLYRNELIALRGMVSSWGESASGGDAEYSGALASNATTLYYVDAQATLLRPCTSAAKMVLTIDGAQVAYNVAMSGNGSSAKSAQVEIATGIPTLSVPTTYPYYIEGVLIYDASDNLLIDGVFSVPLKVRRPGDLSLRVLR